MAGESVFWLDGISAGALPLPDRGLDFGDGLFETLLLINSEPLLLELHLQRLQRGLDALGFPDCLAQAREQLLKASLSIQARGWHRTALRVTVSRGQAERGYAPPVQATPRIIISATELDPGQNGMPPAASLVLADIRWSTQPALAGLKHLNRLEQVLAAGEARNAGADEALMLDQQGNVVSVSSGNLFFVLGDRLLTPAISHCGIAGTRRDCVIRRWGPAMGLAVEEVTVTPAQLASAHEVFYSNSLVGLRPVASFQGKQWQYHRVCAALYKHYQDELPG